MNNRRSISRRAFLGRGLAASVLSTIVPRWVEAQCDLTTSDILGPYYVGGAPSRSVIASPDEAGTRLFLSGHIRGPDCATALGGTIVDAWQASNAGCYSRVQPCPDEDPWNLRGQMLTGPNGEYSLETILPGYYPGRCRHIHWRFAPIDGPVLVTQLYFQGDPRIPSDPYASQPAAAQRTIALTTQPDGLHGVWDVNLSADLSDVGDEGPDPEVTFLHEAFPNPSRGAAMIRFSLAEAGPADLSVFDSAGRRVRRLMGGAMKVGYHTATWDGRDEKGRELGPGIYFCRLTAGGRSQTRKLLRAD